MSVVIATKGLFAQAGGVVTKIRGGAPKIPQEAVKPRIIVGDVYIDTNKKKKKNLGKMITVDSIKVE